MSAYLSFANARRSTVKSQNSDLSNGEISRLLAQMWKNTPDSIKKPFRDEEQIKWGTYKQHMKEWKKVNDKRKKCQIKQLGEENTPFDHMTVDGEKKKKSKPSEDSFGPIDVESGFDEQLGLQGIDPHVNPNLEEMMAASALREVRGTSQMNPGTDMNQGSHRQDSYGVWFNSVAAVTPGLSSLNPVVGAGAVSAATTSSFNQMDMPQFAYNQYPNYGALASNNPQAVIMAQLRGTTNPYHQLYHGTYLRK